MNDLHPFFAELHYLETVEHPFDPLQLGASVTYATAEGFDWEDADVVIIGCGETGDKSRYSNSPDAVRAELYKMYNWHPDIKIADAGNIRQGATPHDTRAALRMVLAEVHNAGKRAIILGGSHDLTMQQYEVFKKKETLVNAVVADMLIDLDEVEGMTERSFLMDMLTSQPNFIRNYSHIGFQSYFVHPRMLETLDKLRFDFFRLGKAREEMEEMEPVLRSADFLSFDMNAIRYPDAIANVHGSPNGFTGDEACMLTRYAGSSSQLSSLGIYGFDPAYDQHGMNARLIAQMMWYFMDGVLVRKSEASLKQEEEFVSFHVSFTDNDTTFLKSKRTGRWWMKLPDNSFIPCSYNDYLTATKNEMPERWIREQERLV